MMDSVRGWIPASTSPKGRLALAAVKAFGERPFDQVGVGELSAAAGVTTGALYHHFGSKLGLYTFVREDVERRLLDRMEGALAVSSLAPAGASTVTTALLVGFDFAVQQGFLHLLGAPPPGAEPDRLAQLLGASVTPASPVLGRVLAAAWRAALLAVADGAEADHGRTALAAMGLRGAPGHGGESSG